jgi:uncharacterized protein
MITLDTSALFALLNRSDRDHERVVVSLLADAGPYLVPCGVLAEIAYLIERRMPRALEPLLEDLESGAFSVDCGEQDMARVRELVRRYEDPSLGFADATVIACAERNGGRVLTLDRRDYGVAAAEGSIEVLPE